MKKLFFMITMVILIGTAQSVDAQKMKIFQKDSTYHPINVAVELKNMNLWRGNLTPGAMAIVNLYYITRDKDFKARIWCASGFNGQYTDLSFIMYYTKNSYFIETIYAYSEPKLTDKFAKMANPSPHFFDIAIGKTFTNIPLTVSLATTVLGKDKIARANGTLNQRFSHYLEAKYKVYNKGGYQIDAFVGGVFSLVDRSTCYSEKPNFTNIGLELNKSVSIVNYKIPLTFKYRYNPERRSSAIEMAVHIF